MNTNKFIYMISLLLLIFGIQKCLTQNEMIDTNEVSQASTPVTIVLTSKPSTTKPSTTRPTSTTKPSTTRPSTTRPSTTRPSTTRPSTTRPTSTKSTTPKETITSTSTQVPSTTSAQEISTTSRRFPCKCNEGTCLCCTGYLLNRFNVTTRNKACLSVQYEPDEFEFNFKLLFNERKLYQTKVSGKNPQPICLPIRRIVAINVCVRFSNVYMLGRNLHACLDFEGDWNDIELFQVSFECFRIGANGVALVRPEEGGGLPIPTPATSNSGTQDYDDSAKH